MSIPNWMVFVGAICTGLVLSVILYTAYFAIFGTVSFKWDGKEAINYKISSERKSGEEFPKQ